jgi:hypothetical protein
LLHLSSACHKQQRDYIVICNLWIYIIIKNITNYIWEVLDTSK